MSYASATASPGEQVLYRTTYHWLYWLAAIALAVGPLTVLALQPMNSIAVIVAACAAAFVTPVGLVMLVHALTTEVTVTSDRFVRKTGLIAIRAEDMSLDKIEEVNLDEGILGAILDYGTIRVNGTGGSAIVVTMVQSPWRLRREIENATELG